MINKDYILQKLLKIKPTLQEKYNLSEIALFGSYSRNEQNENSDIDIMVDMNNPNFKNYCNIYDSLVLLFEGIKVQVVSKGAIKPKYFEVVKNDLVYV